MKTKYPGIEKYTTTQGEFYRVRVRKTVRGRQRERTKAKLKTLVEARAAYHELLDEIEEEEAIRIPTLKEYWEEYRDLKIRTGSWQTNTIVAKDGHMKHWLVTFGDTLLDQITKNAIQERVLTLYNVEHYREQSVKVYFIILRSVLRDAMDNHLIEEDPTRKVITKNPQPETDPVRSISPDDFQRFMAKAKTDMAPDLYRALYLITFGLRRGELLGLKPKAIKFLENGMASLHIECQRTYYAKEGKSPKSKMSNRYVVVDEVASDMLKTQLEEARKIKARLGKVLTINDFIFINPKTGNPYSLNMINKSIHRIAKPLGLHLTPHMFRHTFATYALANGVDSLALQKYLGHANLSMTDYYVDSTVANGEHIVRSMQDFRGKLGEKGNVRK
ncbi:MAG: tyrosine-type recombinase/integrase [Aerococcus sp.]|nr:tyrosine-type recombinase/integrase [Aerococcus sp.]